MLARSVVVATLFALAAGCSGTSPGASNGDPGVSPTPTGGAEQPKAGPPPANGAVTRALLVGVTDFIDKGMQRHNLQGPANDVDLFKQVLERAPLSVPAANIRTLAGLPADPVARPTHANIAREFAHLAEVSNKGDQVVVLMAGHGSQQPANRESQADETDGLDEIFLPADTSGWDRSLGKVKGAIVDDEVRQWVTAIRNKGAFVWIIFDSCQSGTMTRGLGERMRQIPASELVPAAALDAATRRATERGNAAEHDLLGLGNDAGDIAALYAAQTTETTPEKPLPSANSAVHGLFSYTIADLITQSASAMTYRELALRVLERYRSIPRLDPTPMFEGGGLDREILGLKAWPERPQLLLGAKAGNGHWSLDAGSLLGLTVGTVIELFPPAGAAQADKRVGYVRVTTVAPLSATVQPVRFGKVAAPADAAMLASSRGRVTFYESGDARLRVAVQTPTGKGPPLLEQALTHLSNNSHGLAERVSGDSADWFIRVVDDRVVLVPARDSDQKPDDVARVDDPGLETSLSDRLVTIARARNLVRLAASPSSGPSLDFRLVRLDEKLSGRARQLLSRPGDVLLHQDERIELRFKNTGNRSVDVTVLVVDATYGITPFFPTSDAASDNRLKPGEERATPALKVSPPYGWESAVAIAVESSAAPVHFLALRQLPSGSVRGAADEPQSPLTRHLRAGIDGGTRGLTADPGRYVVKLVAWRSAEKPVSQRTP